MVLAVLASRRRCRCVQISPNPFIQRNWQQHHADPIVWQWSFGHQSCPRFESTECFFGCRTDTHLAEFTVWTQTWLIYHPASSHSQHLSVMIPNTNSCVMLAVDGRCGSYRLPKPGDTVVLSSKHWKRNPGVPCQQGRFHLLLTKAIGRGYQSQVYMAELQQCTIATIAWDQTVSPGPATVIGDTSSCQQLVDACKLPSTLTESGRRLVLKVHHRGRGLPTLEGCDEPFVQGARDMYLRIHTIMNSLSPDAHVVTSYLVSDVHAATTSPDAQ